MINAPLINKAIVFMSILMKNIQIMHTNYTNTATEIDQNTRVNSISVGRICWSQYSDIVNDNIAASR